MVVLWWHGGGWDELLLMGGAVALAYLIVKLTVRGRSDEEDEAPATSGSAENDA